MANQEMIKLPDSGIQDIQASILAQAGLDPASLSTLLQSAINVMVESLDATKVTRLSYKGETVETHVEPDTQLRLKAASELANFAVNVSGLKRPSAEGSKAPVTVTVNLPGQILPPEKNVTPAG